MAIVLNPINTSVGLYGDNSLMCISEEFSNHAPRETYLSQNQYEALRAHLQAERDIELGRWRDPQDPDWICYGRGSSRDTVDVINEYDGLPYRRDRDQVAYSDAEFSEVAQRYFDTHPNPKPWDTAQPDEVWALTINNDREEVFRCGERGLYQLKTGNSLGSLLSCGSNKITAGHRIWPEGGAE